MTLPEEYANSLQRPFGSHLRFKLLSQLWIKIAARDHGHNSIGVGQFSPVKEGGGKRNRTGGFGNHGACRQQKASGNPDLRFRYGDNPVDKAKNMIKVALAQGLRAESVR